MTESPSFEAAPDELDLVSHIAMSVVRAALAPLFKKESRNFVVGLLTTDRSRVGDYVIAAEALLEEYAEQHCFKARRQNVLGVHESFSKAFSRAGSFVERVVLVAHVDKADEKMSLACDEVAHLPETKVAHFKAAVKALLKTELATRDARLLSKTKWSDLRFAFREGRRLDDSLSRLRKSATRGPRVTVSPGKVGLESMAGYGEAAAWGMRLARDLEDWEAGKIAWKDVDRGIVLAGPPGVGKTVFATALANSCGVRLVTASFASWQAAGYLNDMLKSMKKSFEEAKGSAPAILFVDEVDSVGSRDQARGDNANYQIQVVNAFLEQLDGSAERDGVVVIGATNRASELDKAILRPGRLERVVQIPMPDATSRVAILEWHSGLNVSVTSRFARETEGWTGADIEAVVRRAKRTARELGVALTVPLIEQELPKREHLSATDLWRVAVHECGHAIVGKWLEVGSFDALILNPTVPVDAGPTSAGLVQFTQTTKLRTKQSYLDFIAFVLGGMAAEIVEFGEFTDGSGGAEDADLCRATMAATELVIRRGMDRYLIAESGSDPDAMARARMNPLVWNRIDAILQEQLARSGEILGNHRATLRAVARRALKSSGLTSAELDDALAKWKHVPSEIKAFPRPKAGQ